MALHVCSVAQVVGCMWEHFPGRTRKQLIIDTDMLNFVSLCIIIAENHDKG